MRGGERVPLPMTDKVGRTPTYHGIRSIGRPKGFRDVYWCWAINEPSFLLSTGSQDPKEGKCGTCECVVWFPNSFMESDDERHTFVCHILKNNEKSGD